MQYKLTAIGGTFDHLHNGHKAILQKAFTVGEAVIIGVTTDEMMAGKPLSYISQPYSERFEELKHFLRIKNYLKRSSIVSINDIYGPAVENRALEAIIVSRETLANARKINRERRKKGLPALKIISIQTIKGIDNKRIASRRIRGGEEDREGVVYLSKKLGLFPYKITKLQREELKKPLGRLIVAVGVDPCVDPNMIQKIVQKDNFVITVGDKITRSCLEAGIVPTIGIVDLKIRRKKIYKSIEDIYDKNLPTFARRGRALCRPDIVGNPRGTITRTLAESVSSLVKKAVQVTTRSPISKAHFCIQVRGEEDLAALPAILFAPLGSLVLYGQPPMKEGEQGGIVVVEVTEKKKQEIIHFLKREF